jgi:hypothetical protein
VIPIAPVPAPNADLGTVAISGGVTVELRQAGALRRPGMMPAGTYEVWADLDGVGVLSKVTSFRLDPGARLLVQCSKLRRECHVQ